MNEQLRQEYLEQGYIVCRGAVPQEDVEAMRQQADDAIEHRVMPMRFDDASAETLAAVSGRYKSEDGKLFRRLQHVVERGGAFERVVKTHVTQAAQQIMDRPVYVFLNRHNMMMLKAPYNPMPVFWHQDSSIWNEGTFEHVSAIVALDDFRPDNGCLEVVPGSHKTGPIAVGPDAEAHKQALREQYGRMIDTQAVKVMLKAGDILLFHGLLFHGSAGNPTPHQRRTLTVALYSGDPTPISTQRGEKAPSVMALSAVS